MVYYEIGTSQADESAVSQRVISAVADAREKSPLELPPLYSVIDPDALDTLFDSGGVGGQSGPGRVVFMFGGCEVVVRSDSGVTVTASDDQAPASPTSDSVDEEDEAATAFE